MVAFWVRRLPCGDLLEVATIVSNSSGSSVRSAPPFAAATIADTRLAAATETGSVASDVVLLAAALGSTVIALLSLARGVSVS